jgi:hypothetical protein
MRAGVPAPRLSHGLSRDDVDAREVAASRNFAGGYAYQAGYGLLRADLSPRPAYTALKTVLTN